MPREIFVIDRFDQGFCNGLSPRDINDAQLVDSEHVDIETVGVLRVIGKFKDHPSRTASNAPSYTFPSAGIVGDEYKGHHIISFESDYQMLDYTSGDELAAAVKEPTEYILIPNTSVSSGKCGYFIFQQEKFDATHKVWASTFSIPVDKSGGGVGRFASFRINNGLRISNYAAGDPLNTRWFGPIHGILYGAPAGEYEYGSTYLKTLNRGLCYNNGYNVSGTKFHDVRADIKACFPEQANISGDMVAPNAVVYCARSEGQGGYFEAKGKGGLTTPLPADYKVAGPPVLMEGEGDLPNDIFRITVKTDWVGYVDFTKCGFRVGDTISIASDDHNLSVFGEGTPQTAEITSIASGEIQADFPQAGHTDESANGNIWDLRIWTDGPDNGTGGTWSNASRHAVTTSIGFANDKVDTGGDPGAQWNGTSTSGHRWGVGLMYAEEGNLSGTWQPSESTRYKFYITTVYDNGTQESLPQLMSMYGAAGLHVKRDFKNIRATSELYFCNFVNDTTPNFDTPGNTMRVHFKPIIKINYADINRGSEGVGASASDAGTFVFGCQSATDSAFNELRASDNGTDILPGNPRISGTRIYWASSDDGYGVLWQMFDLDFAKGCRSYGMDGSAGESGWAPWQAYSLSPPSGSTYDKQGGHYMIPNWNSGNRWLHPPKYRTYFENSFHEKDDGHSVHNWKCGVIANGRAWIGNVQRTLDGSTVSTFHPDRIYRSPLGQYDVFPESYLLDVNVDDGEQIICMKAHADRLFVFKELTLYIINISQEDVFVEETHVGLGVYNENSVCETKDGIAWGNGAGVYHYNGSAIQELFLQSNEPRISKDFWHTFLGFPGLRQGRPAANPHVAYIQHKDALLIMANHTSNTKKMMYYSFSNDAFTYHTGIGEAAEVSQLAVDALGQVIVQWGSSGLSYFDHSDGEATGTFKYRSKDFDFGQPSVRHKIYKLYVTWRAAGDPNIDVKYVVNGLDEAGGNKKTLGNLGSSATGNSGKDWQEAAFVFSDEDAQSAKSISIILEPESSQSVHGTFEVNEMSLVYRKKSIK